MTRTTEKEISSTGELWLIWSTAAGQAGTDRAIRRLFSGLDLEIARRRPTCRASGRCCKFEEFGHRLYVTGLEIAWVLRQVERQNATTSTSVVPLNVESQVSRPQNAQRAPSDTALPVLDLRSATGDPGPERESDSGSACPYQRGRLCSVHEVRPLGCRVFFCEEGTAEWQQQLYERFLGKLRDLHVRLGLPYRYLEWRTGLAEARCWAAENQKSKRAGK